MYARPMTEGIHKYVKTSMAKSNLTLDIDGRKASWRVGLCFRTPDPTSGRLGVGRPIEPSTGSVPIAHPPRGRARR